MGRVGGCVFCQYRTCPVLCVPIPQAAQGAFSTVKPIGLGTGWQYLTGQQYTAKGVLDLTTGTFVRQGVNWSQVGWYGADVGIDAAIGGAVYMHHLNNQPQGGTH